MAEDCSGALLHRGLPECKYWAVRYCVFVCFATGWATYSCPLQPAGAFTHGSVFVAVGNCVGRLHGRYSSQHQLYLARA
eukprot:3499134-Pleurochrysis_carterae.AAC.2